MALLSASGLCAYVERIQWTERIFLPTGQAALPVLERLLKAKPLVDLLGKEVKAGEDEAAYSRAAGPATGMARDAVQQVADAARADWANGPLVTVVQRVADLRFNAPSDTRGAYYQGRVWLVGENLNSAPEVQFVLAHEALGHVGLAAIMEPQQLAMEMNRLRLINPALASAARAQMAEYGYDLTRATQEALADMAGEGATIRGWQKFVNLVQQSLRALGLGHVADWIERHTQAETMSLLRRSREAIESSKAPRVFDGAQAALFSRSAMKDSDANIRRGVAAMNLALLVKIMAQRAMFRNGLSWVDFGNRQAEASPPPSLHRDVTVQTKKYRRVAVVRRV
jgi:hypothetical protein